MIKFAAVIFAISAISCRFLQLPAESHPNVASKEQRPRELLEPVLCTLTVIGIGLLLGFVAGRIKWRRNPNYQQTLMKIHSAPHLGFQKSLFAFYANVFTKELVNRCLTTVKAAGEAEDLALADYFSELCLVWGRFTRNHLHMSIKFYDVAYSLQYFDLFLTREIIVKVSEKEPETVRHRNKRFVALVQSEIEGVRAGRDARFPQTAAFRLMNSFYGGFWEVVFQEMLNSDLVPRPLKLKWPAERAASASKTGFFCF